MTSPTAATRLCVKGFSVQARVLGALIRREVVARYGRQNLGFVWLIVEPMILTVGVMVMWSVIGKFKGPLPIIPFVLTGYALITLWRHVTNSGIFFIRRSAGLLYHRRVSVFDVFLARAFVEFAGSTLAVLTLYGSVRVLGLSTAMDNPGTVVLGWCLMSLLALGTASLIGAASEVSEAVDRFIPALQYLVLPLSGCFFMVDWLTPDQRQIILAVPIIHGFEMVRDGYFGTAVVTHYSASYLALWGLILNAIGLWALHRARDYAHVR